MDKKQIAVFASGEGSNAANIIAYFKNSPTAEVGLLVCNNQRAKVLEKADQYKIPVLILANKNDYSSVDFFHELESKSISLIVLAGFMWLLPEKLISKFENNILNIHPALLPDFGGKGMFGMNVHKAVIASGCKWSGITIHQVNREYDRGKIIFQKKIEIPTRCTPDELCLKIKKLEHDCYPKVIEEFILN